jgi:hypothetical protein
MTFPIALALIDMALGADTFAGIKLGSTFVPSAWSRASDGEHIKRVTVAGLSGLVSPNVCGGKVQSLLFLATYTNLPTFVEGEVQPVTDPAETAAAARQILREGLVAAGYSPVIDDTRWRRLRDGVTTSRSLQSVNCAGVGAMGTYQTCSISLMAFDEKDYTCADGI